MINNIIRKIQEDRKYTFLAISGFCLVFLWFNMKVLHFGFFGFVGLLVYWGILGIWLAGIFGQRAKLNRNWSIFFGLILAVYLTSFFMAFFLVVWKITMELALLGLVVMTFLAWFFRGKSELEARTDYKAEGGLRIKLWMWVVLIFSASLVFASLFLGRTGEFIFSPWNVVISRHLYLYILATFIVFLIVFSRYKLRVILVIVILHSFFLHSYLPVIYKTGFGGDRWRHLGAERWLMDGKVLSPSLLGKNASYKKIGPFSVPEVLVAGDRTSYANQWGLTIFLSWVMGIDAFWVDIFLVFILWSLILPLLLARIGRFFTDRKWFLGLMAMLPALFYPMQFYGSLTVPVAFGFLYFVFLVVLWLKYLEEKEAGKNFLVLLLVLTGLAYLNYALYFILILEIGILVVCFKHLVLAKMIIGKKSFLGIFLGLGVLFLGVIPWFDKISGFSKFNFGGGFFRGIVNLGEFFLEKVLALGWASKVPDFISRGNFIFMQTEESLVKADLFKLLNWQMFTTIFLWAGIFLGILRIARMKCFRTGVFWVLFLGIFLFNHFISMYYMKGERLFAKRMDLTIVFFMLPLAAWGIFWLLRGKIALKARMVLVSLALAIFSGVVYASGPESKVMVGENDWGAGKYIWADISTQNGDRDNYCVLANTWKLLALEAASGREIVGGGFPMHSSYQQPERAELWRNMIDTPRFSYMDKALELTGADFCYLIAEKKWLGGGEMEKQMKIEALKSLFGGYKSVGEVYIFYYEQ